eukprot:CAMPEP_0115140290 /NCGR_PEP_ID=MMETSP0227-20121206/58847_1 /TAXON_ID=89957 /ORGANISM="Polarella glacialis, Strain CCMP 1383" /LENGTH=48 /DNA_ID= /DNA_START= /DNA_END= /DNA_ORIENTATION=
MPVAEVRALEQVPVTMELVKLKATLANSVTNWRASSTQAINPWLRKRL